MRACIKKNRAANSNGAAKCILHIFSFSPIIILLNNKELQQLKSFGLILLSLTHLKWFSSVYRVY
jgi:GTP cyclohydrolase II